MKNATRLTLAAVALLSGLSVASAAGIPKSTTTGSAAATPQPSDTLSLSPSQQKIAWKDINSQAMKETAPAAFSAKVGADVPKELGIKPVPVSTANKVPTAAIVPVCATRLEQVADRQPDRPQGCRDHYAIEAARTAFLSNRERKATASLVAG
jgi:hypothetical protein